jgi:hypothetical protein
VKFRYFDVLRDLPAALSGTYLVQGEAIVACAAHEVPAFSFDVPGRPGRPKPKPDQGASTATIVVTSGSAAGTAVRLADALGSEKGGVVLTDRRLAAFRLVPADPGLKEPSMMDGFKDLGRTLLGKPQLPPYPTACRPVLELPAHLAYYQGVHREQPKNCAKAEYHRIAFADGSVLGLLAA